MRRPIFTSAVIAALLLIANTAWADETYRLRVDGLACPFCAYGVEKKLKNTKGVVGVDIHINDGVVIVTVADGAQFDEARARQIMEEAGFTLRKFEKVEAQDNESQPS